MASAQKSTRWLEHTHFRIISRQDEEGSSTSTAAVRLLGGFTNVVLDYETALDENVADN